MIFIRIKFQNSLFGNKTTGFGTATTQASTGGFGGGGSLFGNANKSTSGSLFGNTSSFGTANNSGMPSHLLLLSIRVMHDDLSAQIRINY